VSRLHDNLIPPITLGRPCERPGIPDGSAAGERVALSSSAHRSQGRAASSAPLNLTRSPMRHVASLLSPARSLGLSTTAVKPASTGVAGRVSVPLFRVVPRGPAAQGPGPVGCPVFCSFRGGRSVPFLLHRIRVGPGPPAGDSPVGRFPRIAPVINTACPALNPLRLAV
jgi:hypothetical protein